jgi:parallel beta-helix repeat protein
MKTAQAVRAGIATDRGLERDNNEDRVYVDQSLGIYLVVDGIGGQAAGEKAAEVAARVIAEVLGAHEGEPADRVRQAIASANNEIFHLAQQNEEWRGMACVLTLVLVDGDRITVGHVGDTRLYLAWDGKLRKLTPDHAPVGEQEDLGELTEEEAMRHPRRNEVFRDVGSRLRQADDDEFIEIRSFRFRDDAAFLLCSDGLSDAVTASGISAIVETYDGNPEDVARRLVDAANHAGGRDNVSVVFVAGPEFSGIDSRTMQEARSRHAITRPRLGLRRWRAAAERGLWLLAGVVIGALIWEGTGRVIQQPTATPPALDAADPHAIQKAMSSAKAGETVMVPAGQFLGPVELKDGVTLLSATPRGATIRMDPQPIGTGATAAVIARGLKSGRFGGFRIVGDATSPLSLGVLAQSSSVEIDDLEISGATDCGVRMEGSSGGVLRSSYVHDNAGCGVWIGGESTPRLTGNRISANGTGKDALRSGIEIHLPAQPLLENNIIRGNGLAGFGDIPATVASEIQNRNVTDEAKLPE